MTIETKYFCDWCKKQIMVKSCPEIVLHKSVTNRQMQTERFGYVLCNLCKDEIFGRLDGEQT